MPNLKVELFDSLNEKILPESHRCKAIYFWDLTLKKYNNSFMGRLLKILLFVHYGIMKARNIFFDVWNKSHYIINEKQEYWSILYLLKVFWSGIKAQILSQVLFAISHSTIAIALVFLVIWFYRKSICFYFICKYTLIIKYPHTIIMHGKE